MLGFEITINEESIHAAMENGSMVLIVNAYHDDIGIYCFGVNDESMERITWYKSKMEFMQNSVEIGIVDMEDTSISKARSISIPSDTELLEEYEKLKTKLNLKC